MASAQSSTGDSSSLGARARPVSGSVWQIFLSTQKLWVRPGLDLPWGVAFSDVGGGAGLVPNMRRSNARGTLRQLLRSQLLRGFDFLGGGCCILSGMAARRLKSGRG